MADTGLFYNALSVFFQTLLYGVFLTLYPLSLHLLLKKNKQKASTTSRSESIPRSHKVQLILNTFTFTTATISMILSFGGFEELILHKEWDLGSFGYGVPIMNSFMLINFVLTDGVVIWRAWVLCGKAYRKWIITAGVLLILTAASVVTTITLRLISTFLKGPVDTHHLEAEQVKRAIDISQVMNLFFSLMANLVATCAIIGKVREVRKVQKLVSANDSEGRSIKNKEDWNTILVIVESGLLYCVSGVIILAGSMTKLPHGTLGDIYAPIHVQLAAIYPTIVLLIVNLQKSMDVSMSDSSSSTSPNSISPGSDSGWNKNKPLDLEIGKPITIHPPGITASPEWQHASQPSPITPQRSRSFIIDPLPTLDQSSLDTKSRSNRDEVGKFGLGSWIG